MSRKSTIEVSSARGIARHAGLLIGDEDVLRVKAVRGTTVTVVRWRWWHTLADRLHRWRRDAAEGLAVRWCALRGHRLDGEYCRCGEREDPDWRSDGDQ